MSYTKEDFKKDLEINTKIVDKDICNEFRQGYLQALKNYENLILFGVNRSLPTSTEPFALIMKQIDKNTKDVLEAIKEMQIVRIHNGPS